MINRIMAFVVVAGVSVPGLACEEDPFLFQLAGESLAEAQLRSDNIRDGFSAVRTFHRQTSDYDLAQRVYLAKVVSRSSGSFSPRVQPSTTIQPIAALKGSLPTVPRTLTGTGAGGMCTDVGDGEGSWSEVGKPIVVFEGLPQSEYRPRGIDSFKAGSIRTVPLLDWLRTQGKDLED